MTKKRVDSNDLAELSEFFIDESSRGFLEAFVGDASADLIEAIPAGKTVLAIGKLFSSAKNYYRTKMLLAFLDGIEDGGKSMSDFSALSDQEQSDLRGLVISQLDSQSDERQSEAMAYTVNAYLAKKIDRLTLVGIISEIKNTNPLLYYFSVDSLVVDKLHTNFGKPVIKGPIHLLPVAFYRESMTEGSIGWDAIPGTAPIATELGQAFFENVYEPMSIKYQI